jgi:sialate O-acetylesterase
MPNTVRGALGAVSQPISGAVFQRQGDSADIPVRVETNEPGTLHARLRAGRNVVDGLDWQPVGENDGWKIEGSLSNVPIGGEYTLDLELKNASGEVIGGGSSNHLLVGDLWILGGQSNMDGCGKLVGLEPSSTQLHAFYYDDRWDVATDPLCWYNEATDQVHWSEADPEKRRETAEHDRSFRQQGAGPCVAFGRAITKRTGVPIGLIVCSHGGTSMTQWDPDGKAEGGKTLYGSMIRRVEAVGGKVAGLLWYQGESDANSDAQPDYKDKMRRFVASVRSDLDSPELPFIYVQIGPFYADATQAPAWNALQNDQLELEGELAPAAMAACIDSELDDIIHLGTVAQRRLGRRLAHLAQAVVYNPDGDLSYGPRPREAVFTDESRTELKVRFDSVNGRFRSPGAIRGFLAFSDSTPIPMAECRIDDEQPDTVAISFIEAVPAGAELWYGNGLNPAVNLTDQADMAAPVFGPMPI